MQQIEDIAREIFSQVRTTIVLNMRFMDMAVFRLRPTPEKVTLATDGEYLYYHPVWLLKRYRGEAKAVTRDYLHVLLHCVFRHSFVHTLVDHALWDLACDIAVEGLICELNQPHFSTKSEVKRRAVVDSLRQDVKPLTAEKLYHYFQTHAPDPSWMALFHADEHDVWYNPGMVQRMSQQAQSLDNGQRQPGGSSTPNSEDGGNGQGTGSGANDDQDNGGNGQGESQSRPGLGGSGQGGSQSDSGQQPFESQTGQGSGGNEQSLSSTRQALENEWRDISEHVQMDLETFAKQQGFKAGNMAQLLAELNREKYNYEAFLKKFAVYGEVMKINDDEFDYIFYTYGLKLFKNMPLIEPLEYKEVKRVREFVIAIDTSGSTSGELVSLFLTKTYNILMSTESFFSKVNIHIVQCDAEIQEVVEITRREEFENYLKHMTIRGLGGTDFRPVFTYVDQLVKRRAFQHLKGLIYFTDGCGTFPERKPGYQTAFVFIQDAFNNLNVPPWAIKLILEKNEI